MEKARKMLHAFSSIFMLMYLFPKDVFGIQRDWFLVGPLIFFVLIELFRISQSWLFPGMREYERTQVSGYVWAGSTLVLSLVLFPPKLVIPIYVCWACLDPLCSILKQSPPYYPMVPFALYVVLFMLLTRIPGPGGLTQFGLMGDMAAAFLTATVALLLEYPTIKGFNDDYLMVIGPLLALTSFNEVTGFI